jgi:DNA-binding transcriptional LysR family regulator
MPLGGVDLNLLIILQALLEEGSVTRAGLRVGMPQPAVSTALARLRRHYKDELLVRSGNGYTLTPLARSLLPEVRESTRFTGSAFSPADLRLPPGRGRTFTVCLSDYSIAVLGKLLLRRMRQLAPDVSLDLRPTASALAEGDREPPRCDLLVAPQGFRGVADGPQYGAPQYGGGGGHEVVCRDRFVYVADPGNSRLREGRLQAADLAALPHAAARVPYPEGDTVAAALRRLGIRPHVAVTTAGWLPLPFVVSGTDMIAAVPERLAKQLSAAANVAVVEPPFGIAEMVESAWWHPLHATDLGLTWLRGVLADVAASLTPVPLPTQRQPGTAARA